MPGWHVDDYFSTSVSTAYRWLNTAIECSRPKRDPITFALFPVVVQHFNVFGYDLRLNGPALSRESQETIPPGDYGIFAEGT